MLTFKAKIIVCITLFFAVITGYTARISNP